MDLYGSRSPNHHMTGFTLLPTQKRGILTSTKWKTQAYGVPSTIPRYLRLDHKEDNTSVVVPHLAAIQLRQMKTTLQFVHMEGEIVSTNDGRRVRIGWCKGGDC